MADRDEIDLQLSDLLDQLGDHIPSPEFLDQLADELRDELVLLIQAKEALGRVSGTFGRGLSGPTQPPAPSSDVNDSSTLPTALGRYDVQRLLGAGGMGRVYLAFDPQMQRQVVVKVPQLRGTPQENAGILERFQTEARAGARIRKHPNVCSVHDLFEQDGRLCVVMEYVEGETLEDRLGREKKFADIPAAVALARQIGEGLAAVHEDGVLHRDLKPGNVLLNSRGQAIITDFGLARILDASRHQTQPGVIMGTYRYMAPEQAQGLHAAMGEWSDVYSLGVILYECLTGRPPGGGDLSPSRHRPEVDRELDLIVVRALAGDPSRRYQTAGELNQDLDRWLQGRRKSRRPGLRLAAFGGLCLLLVLAGWGAVSWLREQGGPATGGPEGKPPRPFRGEDHVLSVVQKHLQELPEADRPWWKYFSLASLHNHPSSPGDEQLRSARVALAKLLNSLSWEQQLVLPPAIDAEGLVLAIDIRKLGWAEEQWQAVLRSYPYGLLHNDHADRALAGLAREVARLRGSSEPVIRLDWFVASASRSPLYHQLLGLPEMGAELERRLGVDVVADFKENRLLRAGLTVSKVSSHHRLVERHQGKHGGYWRTYDLDASTAKANLLENPLGPEFSGHPHPERAFRHAGASILFSLPNGMLGFLLVDGNDRRLDSAPARLLRDETMAAGTPAVVAGLSCLACHREGLKPVQDEVRRGTVVGGTAREKVELLYPGAQTFQERLAQDALRYRESLEKVASPYLEGRGSEELPEPIGEVARLYQGDLGLAEAARELGLEDPERLQEAIRQNERLRNLGLGLLAENGRIRRQQWAEIPEGGFSSLFQRAAGELKRGRAWRQQ